MVILDMEEYMSDNILDSISPIQSSKDDMIDKCNHNLQVDQNIAKELINCCLTSLSLCKSAVFQLMP